MRIADLFVDLSLDDTGFNADLRRTLERASTNRVQIKIDADTTAAVSKIEALKQRLRAVQGTYRADVDVRIPGAALVALQSLRQALRDVDGNRSTATVDVNVTPGAEAALAALSAALARIGSGTTTARVEVNLGGSLAELGLLTEALARLDGRSVDVNVNVHGLAGALAELALLEAAMNRLRDITINIPSPGDRRPGPIDRPSPIDRPGGGGGGSDREYRRGADGRFIGAGGDGGAASGAGGSISGILGPLGAISPIILGLMTLLPQVTALVSGLSAGIIGLGSSIGSTIGILGAMPAAVGALGLLLGTIGFSVKSVSTAVKAYGAQTKAVAAVNAKTGSAAQSEANAIFGAARQVQGAYRALGNSQQALALSLRQIPLAQEAAALSIAAAAVSIVQADRSLVGAQEAAQRAQQNLTLARRDAANTLIDLGFAVRNDAIQQQQAVIALQRAQQIQRAVADAHGNSASANLGVDAAQLALEQIGETRRRDILAQDEAAKKGVEGSNTVVDATRNVRDTLYGVGDAQRAVTLTQAAYTRAVRDGGYQIEAAYRAAAQSQQAVQVAEQGVSDAIRSQTQALNANALQITDAGNAAEIALRGLSPTVRSFAQYLLTLKPALNEVRAAATDSILPGVERGIRSSLVLLPVIERALRRTGTTIGNLAAESGARFGNADGIRRLNDTLRSSDTLIGAFGRGLLDVTDGMLSAGSAAGPLVQHIADSVRHTGEAVASFLKVQEKSGALGDFFQRVWERLHLIASILGGLGRALGNVFSIGTTSGDSLLGSLNRIVQKFLEFTRSLSGESKIRAWFASGIETFHAVGGLIHDVVVAFTGLTRNTSGAQFAEQLKFILVPLAQLIGQFVRGGDTGNSFLVALIGLAQALVRLNIATVLRDVVIIFTAIINGLVTITEVIPGADRVLGLFVLTLVGLKLAGIPVGISLIGKAFGALFALLTGSTFTAALTSLKVFAVTAGRSFLASIGISAGSAALGLGVLGAAVVGAALVFGTLRQQAKDAREELDKIGSQTLGGTGALLDPKRVAEAQGRVSQFSGERAGGLKVWGEALKPANWFKNLNPFDRPEPFKSARAEAVPEESRKITAAVAQANTAVDHFALANRMSREAVIMLAEAGRVDFGRTNYDEASASLLNYQTYAVTLTGHIDAFKQSLDESTPAWDRYRAAAAAVTEDQDRLLSYQKVVSDGVKGTGKALQDLSGQTDITSSAIIKSFRDATKAATDEQRNIAKLATAGVSTDAITALVAQGPQYVAAIAGNQSQISGAQLKVVREFNQAFAENQAATSTKLASDGVINGAALSAGYAAGVSGHKTALELALIDALQIPIRRTFQIIATAATVTGAEHVDAYARAMEASKALVDRAAAKGVQQPVLDVLASVLQKSLDAGTGIGGGLAANLAAGTPIAISAAAAFALGINEQTAAILRSIGIQVTLDDQASTGLNDLKKLTADLVTAGYVTNQQIATEIGVIRKGNRGNATGGPIVGAGTGTSDSAGLFALSNGEFVVRAAAVKEVGIPFLQAINNNAKVPGFAAGGAVGPSGSLNLVSTVDIASTVEAIRLAALKASADANGGASIPYNGGNDTISLIQMLVRSLGSNLSVTSTFRPGGNSYHARHQAVDFSDGTDTAGEMYLDRAWAAKYGKSTAELIHAGGINIKNGVDVGDGNSAYGAATMAQHHNHVHIALSPGSIASGAAGAGVSVGRWGPLVAQVLAELGLAPGLSGKVLRQIATESGGNPGITQGIQDVNSRSGNAAQGLMQVIPPTFRANAGPYLNLGPFDPHASIYAGLHYAMGRYGRDLSGLGEGHGYDEGGWLQQGTQMVTNKTGKPEAVYTSEQQDRQDKLLTHLDAMVRAGSTGGSGGATVHVEHMHVQDRSDIDAVANRLAFLARKV